jgi:hypothetical protein
VGEAEIVGTGAEIDLLSHTGPSTYINCPKAIGMGAIAEACLVVEGEIPGVLDA